MPSESERVHVLRMIEAGTITAEEGLRLLSALDGVAFGEAAAETESPEAMGEAPQAEAPPSDTTGESPLPEPAAPDFKRWQGWWQIPLAVGVVVIVVGGLLMYWAYSVGGLGFWFVCASLPFALGVLIAALAWASRSARWIHIRVKTGETEGLKQISLSFPLPIRFTAWVLRTFGPWIPPLKDTGVDELIQALAESTSPQAPLYVDVTEGKGGERVQVYIG